MQRQHSYHLAGRTLLHLLQIGPVVVALASLSLILLQHQSVAIGPNRDRNEIHGGRSDKSGNEPVGGPVVKIERAANDFWQLHV